MTLNNRPTSDDGCQLTVIYSTGRTRVYLNPHWEEYIVATDGAPWQQWYHTDDLDDAKDTARVMREVTG